MASVLIPLAKGFEELEAVALIDVMRRGGIEVQAAYLEDELQGDLVLGVVDDIQRMVDTDYLVVKTDEKLVEEGFSKSFLLPYIDRYILNADIEAKKIYTKDAKDILEAS